MLARYLQLDMSGLRLLVLQTKEPQRLWSHCKEQSLWQEECRECKHVSKQTSTPQSPTILAHLEDTVSSAEKQGGPVRETTRSSRHQ